MGDDRRGDRHYPAVRAAAIRGRGVTAFLVVVGSVAWLVCILAAGSIGTNRSTGGRR